MSSSRALLAPERIGLVHADAPHGRRRAERRIQFSRAVPTEVAGSHGRRLKGTVAPGNPEAACRCYRGAGEVPSARARARSTGLPSTPTFQPVVRQSGTGARAGGPRSASLREALPQPVGHDGQGLGAEAFQVVRGALELDVGLV